MPARSLASSALLLLVLLALVACGSGSAAVPDPDPDPASTDEEPPPRLDGAVVWVDLGCGSCHGASGAGAFGPDLRCFPADGLVAYVRPVDTVHTAGPVTDLTAEQATALAEFLAAAECASNVPVSHTVLMGGYAYHHPDLATPETSCTPCHGPELEGFGTVPSCASCHGGGGGGTGACTSCHASAQDDGDEIPVGGRRAVLSEFSLASHHVTGSVTDADCIVCHDQSSHMQGAVRLWNVDDHSEVFVLSGDPATSATAAGTLEPFCLACHDDDAADGSAPFSDGEIPAVVDATAWNAGAHAQATLTCLGDGDTFGCHGSGHGTAYGALLTARYVIDDPHERVDGDYQACWNCHSKSTILFGDNAFGEDHKKHVVEEDVACAACHDPHAPYDSGESGMIDLTRAWAAGWLTLPTGTTLSSAFTTTSSGQTCILLCHREDHD